MNSRGQAALEYLMTYGWALVIIVVVAGILFFIMSTPQSGVICSSSDPTKMVLKSSNITAGAVGPRIDSVINLQNGTGGAINTVSVTGASALFSATGEAICSTAAVCTANTAITQVIGGGNIFLYPLYTAPLAVGGSVVASTYTINYKDQFDYNKNVVVTCQGTVPTP